MPPGKRLATCAFQSLQLDNQIQLQPATSPCETCTAGTADTRPHPHHRHRDLAQTPCRFLVRRDNGCSVSPRRRSHPEVEVRLPGGEVVEGHRRPRPGVGIAHHEQVLGDRDHRILVRRLRDELGDRPGHRRAQDGPVLAGEHLEPGSGALVGPEARADVHLDGLARGHERVRHLDPCELLEDLAIEVLVEIARVASVREERDREPFVGQDAQERRLADRVAVVSDQAPPVPAETDPAQPPRVAEGVLVREIRLVLGHGRHARSR